jgi:L-ascorbate metabolism protein UlaG (beta-lactamase superfamily)
MTTRLGKDLIAQMNSLDVPRGCLAIWSLGQMGFALKGDSHDIVHIDPCLTDIVAMKIPAMSDKFVRAFPPPVEPSQVTNASYVLCSHEHLDHTDQFTLGPLAKASPQAKFVITGWSHASLDEAAIEPMRRIVPVAGQPIQLGNLRLTVVPSAHYQLEHDEQKGYRWFGFLIEWNGVTLYHSGDTIIYPGYVERLRELPRADIAILAVNGRDAYRDSFDVRGNLHPAEAVWLAKELGWDTLIGGHNDLYLWNTIGAGELYDAARKFHPRLKVHTLQPGELYLYVR